MNYRVIGALDFTQESYAIAVINKLDDITPGKLIDYPNESSHYEREDTVVTIDLIFIDTISGQNIIQWCKDNDILAKLKNTIDNQSYILLEKCYHNEIPIKECVVVEKIIKE